MTKLEAVDKKEILRSQAEQIINNAEKELRKLTTDETKQFDKITNEIRELDKYINQNFKVIRKMEKFSLLKAINDVANNRNLDERSQEVVNQGIAEMRKAGQNYSGQIVIPVEEKRNDIQATVVNAGEEVVAEDKLNILEPLRANLVLTAAGATYMTGLVGDIN